MNFFRYLKVVIFTLATSWALYQISFIIFDKWDAYQFDRVNIQGQAYLEQTLPVIFSQQETSHLALFSNEEGVKEALSYLKTFGKFQQITAINFVKSIPSISKNNVFFYTIDLQFSNGNAQITVVIEKQKETWIYRYLDTDLSSIAQRTLS